MAGPCSRPFSTARWALVLAILFLQVPPVVAEASLDVPPEVSPNQESEKKAETETVIVIPEVELFGPPEFVGPLPSEVHATDICRLPAHQVPGIEWARQKSFRSACLAAHWLNGLFGSDAYDPVVGVISGYFSLDTEKRAGESIEFTPRIRVHVSLPNISNNLDLYFDRDDDRASTQGDTRLMRQERVLRIKEPSSQVGVRYQFMNELDAVVNLRASLRFRDGAPDLLVRNTYSKVFADSGIDRWPFEQTLYWTHSESWGETSQLDYERHFGGPFMFRWGNSLTYAKVVDGFEWGTSWSIYHALNDHRVIHWSFGGGGETGASERLASYGPRVSFRQRVLDQWLIFEVYGGIDYIKDSTMTERFTQRYLGIKFEAHFSKL